MDIQARFDLETAEDALAPQIKKIASYEELRHEAAAGRLSTVTVTLSVTRVTRFKLQSRNTFRFSRSFRLARAETPQGIAKGIASST
jgi:hypothetical protein